MEFVAIVILSIYINIVGPSAVAAPKSPSQSLLSDLTADAAYNTKQNQYFDSTNMAYVLELSNRKSNQNANVNDDDNNNSNIRNSNLRVLPNYNNHNNQNNQNIHNNNHMNNGNHNNNHENEADEDDNNSVKKTSNAHDGDIHSDNKNYFNHYQFNNGEDLEHSGGGGNNPLNRGPFFDVSASKNVTALVGKMANLNCRIKNLGNKTVTWIRHRDLHLLTVDKTTYTSDQRFVSVNNPQIGDWSLQIRHTQLNDSGTYECQVSTTPPVGFSMILSVVEPVTTIQGGSDLYIDIGSTINLTCIVRHLPEPPVAILWAHNNQEINYDSPRGGVSVITEKGEVTTSYLLIQKAKISDSGKYTCLPTHANPSTVNVHVLNGEEPAAIQRGHHLQGTSPIIFILLLGLVLQR